MNRYCNRLTQIQRRLVALLMDRYCARLTQIQRRLAALLTMIALQMRSIAKKVLMEARNL